MQACHVCDGDDPDCATCSGRGEVEYKSCPQAEITPDIWRFFKLKGFAEKGAWPVAGGTLDQTQIFLDAVEYARSEEAAAKARLNISDESD